MCIPLAGYGELPTARNALDHNVALLDAALKQLSACTLDKWGDNFSVPAGMDNSYSKVGAYNRYSRYCWLCGGLTVKFHWFARTFNTVKHGFEIGWIGWPIEAIG